MRKLIIFLIAFFLTVNIAWSAPKAGDKAPGFSLTSIDGKKVSLDEFKGKLCSLECFTFASLA